MPDLLDKLMRDPTDPVEALVNRAPLPDPMDIMVEKAVGVVNADVQLVTPAERTIYIEQVADVRAYRDGLGAEEREEYEGRIVAQVGARAVNEFFGYHKPLSAVRKAIRKGETIAQAEERFRVSTGPLMNTVRRNAQESARKRKRRVIVGDWLETTRAAAEARPKMKPGPDLSPETREFFKESFEEMAEHMKESQRRSDAFWGPIKAKMAEGAKA